ncbi:MAG: SDR family oxidoreductase [Methylophaga sp.]|nr:SDR family oxidoreductase [Methylophaga sp.]
MNPKIDVQGKTVLVTGANRGIGKAIVEEFIQKGAAKVYLAVRNTDSVKPLLLKHGEKVAVIELDVADGGSISRAAQIAEDVNIVVNNAGILKNATALDPAAIEALDSQMQVNVVGLIRMAQAFAPVLKQNGGGAFVQLNSIASLRAFPEFVTYAASKAAAYSITQALQTQLVEQGTAVVSVHPGPIKTDMATDAGFEDVADPPSIVAEAIVAALQAGEFHVFPDTMAKEFWAAYQGFAKQIVEAQPEES